MLFEFSPLANQIKSLRLLNQPHDAEVSVQMAVLLLHNDLKVFPRYYEELAGQTDTLDCVLVVRQVLDSFLEAMEALGSDQTDSDLFFVLEMLNAFQFNHVVDEALGLLVVFELVTDLRQELFQVKLRPAITFELILNFLTDFKLAFNHQKQVRHWLPLGHHDIAE